VTQFLALTLLVSCDGGRKIEVETRTFPSGEVATNSSWLDTAVATSPGSFDTHVNEYSVTFAGSETPEVVGRVHGNEGRFAHHDNVQIVHARERTALIVGRHIFKRWDSRGGPSWYAWSPELDSSVRHFLRSVSTAVLTSSNDPLPYRVASVDLDKNILVLEAERDVTPWPTKLVFTADRYRFTWQFHANFTRKHNPPIRTVPFPGGVEAEFVVITLRDQLSDLAPTAIDSMDAVLALEGSTILETLRTPVDDKTRRNVKTTVRMPDGAETELAFDILGACGDPDPSQVNVHLRPLPLVMSQTWRNLRFDVAHQVQANGYAGGTRLVFVKLWQRGETRS